MSDSVKKWEEIEEAEEARRRVVEQNGNSGLHYVSSTTETFADLPSYTTDQTNGVEKGIYPGDQLKFNFWETGGEVEKASEYYAHNNFCMHETNSYKELKRGFEAGAKWATKNKQS